MEGPSCWSRAVWGAGVGTEVGGASSHSAPHTAIAAIAEALQERHSHPRWTDAAAGTSHPYMCTRAHSEPTPCAPLAVLEGSPRTEWRKVEMTPLSMMTIHVSVQRGGAGGI